MNDQEEQSVDLCKPSWFWRLLMPPHRLDVERLAGEVAYAESRQQRETADDEEIKRLLACAKRARDNKLISLGWQHVRSIRELLILKMDDPALLRIEAIALAKEAKAKIDKGRKDEDAWRRESILELLAPILKPNSASIRQALVELLDLLLKQNDALPHQEIPALLAVAMKQVDNQRNEEMHPGEMKSRLMQVMCLREEYFDTVHFKNGMWRFVTNIVCLVMVVAVVFLGCMFSTGALGTVAAPPAKLWKVVATIVSLGVLGASFSTLRALTSNATRHTDVRIPDQFLNLGSLFRRLFIGAGAALVAYLLVLKIDNPPNVYVLYLTAFAAGFSDNLVEKGIGEVQKRLGGSS